MIEWKGDSMHAVGCMEKLEDNQVLDLYFFTREKKMKVYKDYGEKLGQRKRKVILHFALVLMFYPWDCKDKRQKIKTISGNVRSRAKLVDLSFN